MRCIFHYAAGTRAAAATNTLVFGFTVAAVLTGTVFAEDTPLPAAPIARKDTVIFELAKPIADPKNFNWYFAGSLRDGGADQAMWEPLFLADFNSGQLEPWLALSLKPNPGQDVWTLTLRKGVEWSDSTPAAPQLFTAADVLFTVKIARELSLDLPAYESRTVLEQVESATKGADDQTVVFKLKKSNPRFALENFGATRFSSFLIMPEHIWKGILVPDPKKGPADFRPKPIGTGPYVLKASTATTVTWVRNGKWWGIKAGIKLQPSQLVWQVVNDDVASEAMLVANQIDAAREYTLEKFNDAKNKNTKIIGWDTGSPVAWNDPCPRQLDINIKYLRDPDQKLTPWSDPNLRKALSLLIDRTNLAKNAYGGTTQPSRTMFVQYKAMNKFIDAVTSAGLGLAPTADPAAAQALLGPAGYVKDTDGFYKKDSEILTATIIVDVKAAKDLDGANEVAKQLNDNGIKAKVVSLPNEEYWGRAVPKGDYEMAYGWLSCGSVIEPYTSMARYTADKSVPLGVISPGWDNTGRWGESQAAKDYSAIVQTISGRSLDDASIPGLVATAYKSLADEMPFIPLVQSPKIIPFNTTYWTGWPAAGGNAVPMHSWAATHRLIRQLRAN